jgi:hypothetical protein
MGLRWPFVVMGALMLGCAAAVSLFVRRGLMPTPTSLAGPNPLLDVEPAE